MTKNPFRLALLLPPQRGNFRAGPDEKDFLFMSTSKLQRYVGKRLDELFPHLPVLENNRPFWLVSSCGKRLELDFYIEDIKLAIEVQGDQHFSFVEFFHKNYDEFLARKRLDEEKKDLCYGRGINLVEINSFSDADVFMKSIEYQYTQPTEPEKQNKSRRIHIDREPNPKSKRTARKADPDFEYKDRYDRCIKNLSDYENGLIAASDEKVNFWRETIENNGYSSEWKG